ncbi:hypothetical protein [Erythrobacter sp. THAF29]|uniref:hypothetical protein n=1 Tax=Erythrobacter sp. THAF29 TaxID=2587851 RepID=UPI001269716E|nr:hypothetical protein [Erythrobacter sp. THAF29]QFT76396.1 hypothetical protein FIU90_02455 [Erythrobacter sp. THAF29]
MWIAVFFIFLLGVVNFALHGAVIEGGNRTFDQVPGFVHLLGGRLSLAAEFLVLLLAMLLAANGWPALAWGYLAYTLLNAGAAWLMLKGRGRS